MITIIDNISGDVRECELWDMVSVLESMFDASEICEYNLLEVMEELAERYAKNQFTGDCEAYLNVTIC